MFSSYLNFLKFLHYLKNYECDENPYYEDITSVSQDKHGTSWVCPVIQI